MKACKVIGDAFEQVKECVIACGDANSGLTWIDITLAPGCIILVTEKRRAIRTVTRTSTLTNNAFAGWKSTYSHD
jgi:hypothetical protein